MAEMTENAFVKAQSDNLLNIDQFMLTEFIRSSNCFKSAEIRRINAEFTSQKARYLIDIKMDDDKSLAREVAKYPCLVNPTHPDYNNQVKQHEAWGSIAGAFFSMENKTTRVANLKQRWEHLMKQTAGFSTSNGQASTSVPTRKETNQRKSKQTSFLKRLEAEVSKRPLICNETSATSKNVDEWKRVAKLMANEKWQKLTPKKKKGLVKVVRKLWQDIQRKKKQVNVPTTTLKQKSILKSENGTNNAANTTQKEPLPSTLTRDTPMLARPQNSRDEDAELLSLFLLPKFKQLEENDKPQILFLCYQAISKELSTYNSTSSTA